MNLLNLGLFNEVLLTCVGYVALNASEIVYYSLEVTRMNAVGAYFKELYHLLKTVKKDFY
jgi:hypothetical protein